MYQRTLSMIHHSSVASLGARFSKAVTESRLSYSDGFFYGKSYLEQYIGSLNIKGSRLEKSNLIREYLGQKPVKTYPLLQQRENLFYLTTP